VFTLKGKPVNVSREFVRAWVHATLCVMTYHGRQPPQGIVIRLAECSGHMGEWSELLGRVLLDSTLDAEDMATTIVHELVHACCGDFGDGTNEKCTSTLTAKLKPTIAIIAQAILDNTYKNAAYFAHTKLTYRAVGGDHYDTAEDAPVGVEDKYRR
jgi:hypothetical protein